MTTTETLRSRALAAIEGYGALGERVKALGLRRAQVALPPDVSNVRAEIVRALAAGEEVDDPARILADAQAARLAAGQTLDVYRAAVEMAETQREALVRERHAPAFVVLQAELDSLMRAMRDLSPLPASAEDAMRERRAFDYADALVLVQTYIDVRTVQRELWRLIRGEGHSRGDLLAWLRPEVLVEVETPAGWFTGSLAPTMEYGYTGPRPWPGFDGQTRRGVFPVADEDRLAWLEWASKRDALWAPTPGEADAAYDAIVTGEIDPDTVVRPKPYDGRPSVLLGREGALIR